MEELDKLKNHWNKSAGNFPKFSEKDIYAMLHKKSSSIVKWILIISILEFLFWLVMSFLLKDSNSTKMIESLDIDYITMPMSVIGYGIIIYFLYQFYISYRKITTTDNVKTLMANILNTRKTVSNYIYVNLAYIIISCILIFVIYFYKDEALIAAVHQSEADGNALWFYLIYIVTTIICLAIFILIIWLFYKLIYGILLKRLHRNYEELKKIDF